MLSPLDDLLATDGFMPHGHCYLWNPNLIALHVISDGITALSYTSIPFTLVYFARKRRDIPFNWMFWCFGIFIVACGATHYMDIWTLWTPQYWLAGVIKAITAAASLPTAVLLVRLIPQALAIPTPTALRETNEQLRQKTDDLRAAQTELEARITERTRELQLSQDKLRHAQKMEAVGRLAGGVAHDFNNLLSVVLSYSTMMLDGLAADHPMRSGLTQIEDAGQRAASLTQQLLAFSRQQLLRPKAVDLNETIRGLEKMLARLIGEHIAVETSLAPTLGLIHVDPGQIEQVVVNLVVNARDAMPKGGRVVVTTAETDSPSGDGSKQVVLTIADDGCGMDAATLERVYEPFFTTKDVGKGTGLGLATVFGIVQQSGGRIDVESAVDRGTTVTIRFPRMMQAVATPDPSSPRSVEPTGSEIILVVEDEPMVRTLVVEILKKQGYSVLTGASGQEAIAICEREPKIDLLLTDVIMPIMDGRELAQRIAAKHPEVRILLMSGYPNDVLDQAGTSGAGLQFLRKPIRPKELAQRVREVLDVAVEPGA